MYFHFAIALPKMLSQLRWIDLNIYLLVFQLCALVRMTGMVADKDVPESDLEPYKSPEVVLKRLRRHKEEQLVKKLKILKLFKPTANPNPSSIPEQSVNEEANQSTASESNVDGQVAQGSSAPQGIESNQGRCPSSKQSMDDDLQSLLSLK